VGGNSNTTICDNNPVILFITSRLSEYGSILKSSQFVQTDFHVSCVHVLSKIKLPYLVEGKVSENNLYIIFHRLVWEGKKKI
jgi:hypothetical protein